MNTEHRRRWSIFWKKGRSSSPFYIVMDILRHLSIYTHMRIGYQLFNGGTILEAGCGSAQASMLLIKKTRGRLIGIDFSSPAIRKANEISRRTNLDANFILADILSLPLRSNVIDLAWNMGVVEHFSDPYDVISEMARVTRSNGVVCVIIPTHNNLLVRIRDLIGRITGFYFDFVKYWGGVEEIQVSDAAMNAYLPSLFVKIGLSGVRVSTLLSELFVEQVILGRKTMDS